MYNYPTITEKETLYKTWNSPKDSFQKNINCSGGFVRTDGNDGVAFNSVTTQIKEEHREEKIRRRIHMP